MQHDHVDKYTEDHGEDAGLVYAFTSTQIEMLKGYGLLAQGKLSPPEQKLVEDKIADLASIQMSMLVSLMEITNEDVAKAMDCAGAFYEKLFSKSPLQ